MFFRRVPAALLALVCISGCTASGSILRDPPEHGSHVPTAAGATFTYGLERLLPQGASVVITNVELLMPENSGIKVVGVQVAGPDRGGMNWQLLDGFPPREAYLAKATMSSLPARIPDGEDWELLIGIKVEQPGMWRTQGINIEYEANGKAYRQVIKAILLVCTDSYVLSRVSCKSS